MLFLTRGLVFFFLFPAVGTLKCYVCDNAANSACGEYFKSYQFRAVECPGSDYKCGKQTQPPLPGGWIGVIRSCYQISTLPGMNESDGCHDWTTPDDNFTAMFCFCSLDMCNVAHVSGGSPVLFSAVTLMIHTYNWCTT